MRKTLLLISFLSIWVSTVFGQTYKGGYDFLFLERSPSPRGNGFAGSLVAAQDGLYSVYFNPALIVDSVAMSFVISTSKKFYLADEARYLFLSAGFLLGKNVKVAVSRYQWDFNEKLKIWTGPNSSYEYEWIRSINQVTFAWNVKPFLSVGTNLAIFDQNVYQPDKGKDRHQQTFFADLGILYRKKFKWNSILSIGGNIKNITSSLEKFQMDTLSFKQALPVVLYFGTSYKQYMSFLVGEKSYPSSMTVSITYRDLLNYKYENGISGGVEFDFAGIIRIQGGYYYYTSNDYGLDINRKSYSGVTFGVGSSFSLIKPFQQLPVKIDVDISNVPQPPRSKSYSFDRTWVLGIRIAKR